MITEMYGPGTMYEVFVMTFVQNLKREVTFLRKFKYEVFDHPLYIPDMAPSDYRFFTKLKNLLSKEHF